MISVREHEINLNRGISPHFPFEYTTDMAIKIIEGIISSFSRLQTLEAGEKEYYKKAVLLFLLSETNFRGYPGWADFPVGIIADELELSVEAAMEGIKLGLKEKAIVKVVYRIDQNGKETRYRFNLPKMINKFCGEET